MDIKDIKDYSNHDTARTIETTPIVTEHDCHVESRKFTYLDDNDEMQLAETITMEVPDFATSEHIVRSLEELRLESELYFDDEDE